MRNIILGMSAIALAAVATPALAEDDLGGFSVSGNAAITTDYRFRGVSLSKGDVAIQGGIDLGHESGFYVGTWASSIEEDLGFGHTELDIYGGWSGDIAEGVTADIGVLYYAYPNAPDGDFDYWEPYASIGTTLGPVEATFGVAYAPDQDSLASQDNLYLYTDLGFGIPGVPLAFSGHLGYTDGVLSFDPDGTSWDWSLGADYSITDNLSFGVMYTGVEGTHIDELTDDTVVATLSVSF
ncbi:MAG: TorF family putative porin [Sphingobium sp.]|nr:TorF family putative porin [Sphingobium sp.]